MEDLRKLLEIAQEEERNKADKLVQDAAENLRKAQYNEDGAMERYEKFLSIREQSMDPNYIPESFWQMVSGSLAADLRSCIPSQKGTTYIKLKINHNGIEVSSVKHQKRSGRPRKWLLVIDGQEYTKYKFVRDFRHHWVLPQHDNEPVNGNVSWKFVWNKLCYLNVIGVVGLAKLKCRENSEEEYQIVWEVK